MVVARCMGLCCHRLLSLPMPTGALGVACLVTSTACCLCMLPRCCGKRSNYTVIENSSSFRHINEVDVSTSFRHINEVDVSTSFRHINEVDASSKRVKINDISPLLT